MHGQVCRFRCARRQAVAVGEAQRQRLLGVEVLPRGDRARIQRLVEVARHRDRHGVDVRAIEQPARVVTAFGTVAARLLDDPLPSQPMLGLGVADRDDRDPRQFEQAPQQRRPTISDPDHPQPDRGRRLLAARGTPPGCPASAPGSPRPSSPRNRRRFTRIGGIETTP